MRICSGPGCGRAVPDNVRFCDECKAERPIEQPRMGMVHSTDAIMREYDTKQWQALRRIAKQRHPYCVGWRKTCNELSIVADHNIPARVIVPVCKALGLFPLSRYPGFYIASNLVGLCHSCHNRKTLVEDTLDWTEALVTILSTYLTSVKQGERRAKVIQAYRR